MILSRLMLSVALISAINFFAAPLSYGQLKIAFIDGLSGPMANAGEASLNQFRFIADKTINANGGIWGQKIEIIPIDNKGSPQETLVALKSATDQGIRYILQGNGSGAAAALIDGINKWNDRNPDKSVLYLNYGSIDPTLTNEKCSFWHFSFDANSSMRLEAMTNFLKKEKEIKRVFIIGQNYAHGQQVSEISTKMLAKKRPDVTIVGNVLHPIGQVKDFSPYIFKIKEANADAVITGNWGNDLSLLIKAAKESGLKVKFFTFFAGSIGTPAAIGSAGNKAIFEITDWHRNLYSNSRNNTFEQLAASYNATNPANEIFTLRMYTVLHMLKNAINKANSTDPYLVAKSLEDLKFKTHNGDVQMRKLDHQLQQPLHMASFEQTNNTDVRVGLEGTDYGFKTLKTFAPKDTTVSSSCQMKRP